ncbi:hypothetical protein ACFL4G_08470 [Thermodesulfobacteriota bacterium]
MPLKKTWTVFIVAAALATSVAGSSWAQEKNILEEIQEKIILIKDHFHAGNYSAVVSEGRILFNTLENPRQRIQIGKVVLRSYIYLLDETANPELMTEFLDFAKVLGTKTKDDEIYADIGKYSYERYQWAQKSGILDESERTQLRREALLYLWKAITIRDIEEGHDITAVDDPLLFAYVRLFCDICMDFSIIECESNAYIILMQHLYEIVTQGLDKDTFDRILADPANGPDDNITIMASYLKAIGRIMEYDNGNLCASTYFEKAKIVGKQLEYESDPDKKLVYFEQGHDYLEKAAMTTRDLTIKADRYMDLATFLKVYEMLKTGKEFSQLLIDIIKYMRLAFQYNPNNNDIRTFYGYSLIDYVRDRFNRREYEDAKRYAVEATNFEWPDIESAYYELSRIQSYIEGEELKAYQNALKALKILDKKYPASQDANIEDLNIITKKLNFINQARLTAEPISAEKRREMELRKAVIQGGTAE